MELAIDSQRQTVWLHWSAPTLAALGVTYIGLWLLTYGLVHRPSVEWLPLDVVLIAPLRPQSVTPESTRPAAVAPPQSVKKPTPAASRNLLTREPVTTPTEVAVPAPPLRVPPSSQPDVVTQRESAPVQIANPSVTLEPPPLETVPASRLTRTPAFEQKTLPEDPKGVSMPMDGVRVVVRITLDATAAVRDVEIIKSGGAAFDAAVITAIRRSRFTPGYIDDHPVAVAFNQSYRFQLQ